MCSSDRSSGQILAPPIRHISTPYPQIIKTTHKKVVLIFYSQYAIMGKRIIRNFPMNDIIVSAGIVSVLAVFITIFSGLVFTFCLFFVPSVILFAIGYGIFHVYDKAIDKLRSMKNVYY